MKTHIEGFIAAPFTPMDAECKVNLDVVEKQAEFLHRNSVVGAFVCGTTGEGLSLTVQERLELASRWVQVAPSDFKVLIHVGHTSIEACKTLAANAAEIGAWGIGMVAPCFLKPQSVDDLVAFCKEVATVTPQLPFYYYHMPSTSGVNFPMIDFLEVAAEQIPNLAGIKYTHEDMMDFGLCCKAGDGAFDVLFGRDEFLLCGLALGTRGAIGCSYNIAAPLYTQLIAAFDAGDMDTARTLQRKSMDLIRLGRRTSSPDLIAFKAVMKMLGIDCGPVRRPLRNLTLKQFDELRVELENLGFFEYCSK